MAGKRRGVSAVLGVGLLAAAAATGVLAVDDFRAGTTTRALAAAGSERVGDARRARALADADAALAGGARTAELAELAASRALIEQPADLDAAEAQSLNALRRSPARAGSWARLAYIDVARDGRLDPPGVAALAKSYEVQPYAPEALRRWRLEFTLTRWSEVDEALRSAALREARAATAGGARWYEESLWAWGLAERLPEEAGAALMDATTRLNQGG